MSFTATAFVPVFNESDILRATISHLIEQGVGVHVLDNWSTDGSDQIAQEFPLLGFERFPAQCPPLYFSMISILRRVEELGVQSKADWCVMCDADEIMRSSRRGETLLNGFQRVGSGGWNAVGFRTFHFALTDDGYEGDPEGHFRHHRTDDVKRVRAWRNAGQRVDFVAGHAHVAKFRGMKVPQEQFILKHYPLRSAEQAERKVLYERLARYDPAEVAMGWHWHYRELARKREWIESPKGLEKWNDLEVAVA